MSKHKPTRDKIPAVLQSLPWEEMTLELLREGWYDMDQFLVLVPVCRDQRASQPHLDDHWFYEIHVVTIRADEDYFSANTYGEDWGWSMEDVDYFVRLT